MQRRDRFSDAAPAEIEPSGSFPAHEIAATSAADPVADREALAELRIVAGTLAHDLNNLLAAVHMGADLLCQSKGLEVRGRRQAAAIQAAAKRGSELVQRLRHIARPGTATSCLFDAQAELTAAIELFTARTSEARIEVEHVSPSSMVRGFPGIFQGAVLNVLLNAQAANQRNRPIVVHATQVQFDADRAAAEAATPPLHAQRYLVITIRDQGCGMSAETLRRCTEPFFTTKGSEGTGLGLHSVMTCMREHHGSMRIASQVDHGTTVALYVPLVQP